jgi:hypothetical protein
MFFYWQQAGGQERWHKALAEARPQIIAEQQPRLTTVLDVSRSVDDCPPEEIDKIKYRGPFYVDFDAADLSLASTQFQKLLGKLEDNGVNLRSLYLYATGGRGFHIEVPLEAFFGKSPKDGILHLPLIYKEMAYRLVVDTMDLRIYSAKRGRMWRTPNVQRENGNYKVPISLEEAQSMTPELYAKLCTGPRTYVNADVYYDVVERGGGDDISIVPFPEPASFSHGLGILFLEAQQKVADATKKKRGAKKDRAVIEQFKGQWPPTVQALLKGEKLSPDAGWNQIAMQIAIVANALGKDHEKVVEEAQTLIQSHHGDSARYGTPAKREAELRTQLAYTQDNPCYVYAAGAIKALLVEGEYAADLAGITDKADVQDYEESKALAEETEGRDHTGGLLVGTAGIRLKDAEGIQTLSVVGFDNVVQLTKIDDFLPVGFEADLYYRGTRRLRTVVTLDSFSSRGKLNQFFSSTTAGTFTGSDIQAAYVQESLVLKAKRREDRMGEEYMVRREGLDIIKFPATVDVPEVARTPFPVLGTTVGCAMPKRVEDAGMRFRFYGNPNPLGFFQTDVMLAPQLENSERVQEVLLALMGMNKEKTIAPVLGWFCAAHARMFYHAYKKQFPLLAVSGQSGSGKTTTTKALMHLHFYKQEPKTLQAGGSSIYGLTSAIQGSASVPCFIDEYKPRELPPGRTGLLLSIFRACYDNGTFTKGGGTQGVMANGREITEQSYSAPVLFLGEAPEMQTAIVERSIQATFDKQSLYGREENLKLVQGNLDVLASVGRRLAELLLWVDFDRFCETFDRDYAEVESVMKSKGNYRIVYNYAVGLHGLTLLGEVLRLEGIDTLGRLDDLRKALLSFGATAGEGSMVVAKSEAAKVLTEFAMMSLIGGEGDSFTLYENQDYAYSEVGGIDVLEVCLPFAFTKYEDFCRRRGRSPLYDNEDAFELAMRNFVAFFDAVPSKLTSQPNVMLFRMDRLQEERVTQFKKKR